MSELDFKVMRPEHGMSPRVNKLVEELEEVCCGEPLGDALTALFAVYIRALLDACSNFAEWENACKQISFCPDANGRQFFKVNN